MSQKEPFDLKKFILSSKSQTDAKRPKKTKFHYTKKVLMGLSKNPASSLFPECLSKDYLNDDGRWDPVKWSNEPLRPRIESESDNESVTERTTRNDTDKIKLQPMRKSFVEGCHIEKPKSEKFQQAIKSTSRMPTFRSSHQSENPPNSTRPYKSSYQPEHDYDRSSSSYRNRPTKKFQNNFMTYQGRNNGNASSSKYYNNRGPYRGQNDYNDELEEPEWMRDGPESQFDTIELTGFDDDKVTDDFSWMGEKMPTDDLDDLFKKKKKNNSNDNDKKVDNEKSEEKKTPTNSDKCSTIEKNSVVVQEDEFTDPAIQLTIKDMNDENAYKLKEAVGGSSAVPVTKPPAAVDAAPTRLENTFASGDHAGMTVESLESQNLVSDTAAAVEAARKEQNKTTSSRLLPFFQAPDASNNRSNSSGAAAADPAILSSEDLPKNHHDGLLSFLDASLQSNDGGSGNSPFRMNGLSTDSKIPGAIAMPNSSNQTTSSTTSAMNLASNLSNISNAANQNHEEMNAYHRLVTNLRATDQSKQRNRNQQMLEIQKHQSLSMMKGQIVYNDPSKSNQMLQMELQKIQKLRQMDNKGSKPTSNNLFNEDSNQNNQSPFAGLSDHTSLAHNQLLSEMDGRQATASLKAKLKMNTKSNSDPDNNDMGQLTFNNLDQTKTSTYFPSGISRSNSMLSTTTTSAISSDNNPAGRNDAVVTTARILSRLGLDQEHFLAMNPGQRDQLLSKVKAEMIHKDAAAHRAMYSNNKTANQLNIQAAILQAQQNAAQHQQMANFEAKKNLLFQTPNAAAAAQIAAANQNNIATAQQRQQMMNAMSTYNMSNQNLLAAAAQQQRQNQILQQQQQQQNVGNQVLMWNLQQRHQQQQLLLRRQQQQQQQQQFVVAAMQHNNSLPQNSNFHAGITAAGLHHQQQQRAVAAGNDGRSGNFQNPLLQWFPSDVLRHSQFPNAAGGGGIVGNSAAVTATSLEQHLANAAAAGKTVGGGKVVAGSTQQSSGGGDQLNLP